MNEYNVREKIKAYVQEIINSGISEYIQKYGNDIRYLLYYPLIDLEMSMREELPESITNWGKRATIGFLIQNTYKNIENAKIDELMEEKDYIVYRDKLYPVLNSIMQDSRTLAEISDGSSIAKSKIEEISLNRFRITTSLVSDKYKEENFYFYGMDDKEIFEKDNELIEAEIDKFIIKYISSKENIRKLKRLHIDIDEELLKYCKTRIDRDLLKLGDNLKSKVFKNINELSLVLSYLYYLSFISKLKSEILQVRGEKIELKNYLLDYDKEWLINKISKVQRLPFSRVSKI